ncbi:MAG: YncE family protein [Betaproteobacteria bacterium]|nr:YncE family protein [Betaproteobacteria bacterium]
MSIFSRPIGLMPMPPITYLDGPGRAGTTPEGFSLNSPTGMRGLIAVDKVGGKVRFYDPVSFKEIGALDVDKLPHEVAIAPDHRTAYVSIYGPGIFGNNPTPAQTIAVIDLDARSVRDTISVAPYFAPHGMMVAADGRLWVSCDASAKIVVVNPATKKVEEAFDTGSTGSHWITMTPDGAKIYVSNKTASVGVFDVALRKLVKSIELPSAKQGTEGIAVSPDGKRVLVVDNFDARVHVIDTATDQIVESVELQGNPPTNPKRSRNMRIRFSLDGRFVVTANFASGVIYIHDATDLGRQTPMVVAKGPMGFAFAPDLKTAIVANHDSGIATVFDLEARKVLGYFDGGSGIETLTYW